MRINLTKEDTLLLKGAAIMAIIFHNFYHKFEGGIVENEFTFHPNSYWEFWESFLHPGFNLFNNFFSFYGHYGVSVFFFVSGYGLAKKYALLDSKVTVTAFMTEKIRKFWLLMVPLLLVCMVGFAAKVFYLREFHDALEHMKVIMVHMFYKITFTSNFISEEEVYWLVGLWWFFSAILQIYLIYWLMINKTSSNLKLFFIAILCVLLQIAVYSIQDDYLSMIRYNFPAWLPIFIIGVMCGRKSTIRIPFWIACFLFFLCFVVDVNVYSWLAGSIFFFFVFLFLSYYILGKSVLLKSIFVWLGGISAYLFVLNGLLRHLSFLVLPPDVPHPAWIICMAGLLHFAVCILLAVCYKRFLNFITK